MAEVDFSNAKIEPMSLNDGNVWINPTVNSYLTLNSLSSLYNVNGVSITDVFYPQIITNASKRLVILYSGTFSANGTEFYLPLRQSGNYFAGWRFFNITFSAGDTFMFKVRADLICQ